MVPYKEIFFRFKDNIFFSHENINKTYFDFQEEITNQALIFKQHNLQLKKMVVKNSNPYSLLVEVFALWSLNKTPVLISPKTTDINENLLLDQINLEDNFIEDEAFILFTSGSTDIPKGVSITFSNLNSQIESFSNYFKTIAGEKYLLNLPLNHVGGLLLSLRAFYNGGTISTHSNSPYTYISLVPHQFDQWINDPTLLPFLQRSKAILIGGAILSSALKKRALKLDLPIFETYGMTETTSFIALNGEILPGSELKILDDGTISIKGPMLAAGYYQNKQFIRMPTWFETTDNGAFDENNKFTFTGRKGNILISGGENISTAEINKVALSIPGVKQAYSTGVPDERLGDLVTLLYESELDLTKELKDQLSKALHPYHVPKYIFNINFTDKNKLKYSDQEIKELAYQNFLKQIFSHTYILNSHYLPTIVIFHGFMESKEDWIFLTLKLRDSYNFLIIDLPGHGQTEITPFSSLNEILTRLRDFICLFSPSPILLGYSMGGRIALNLAENYLLPQRLILISASLGLNSNDEKVERLKSDLALFNKIENNYNLKNFFRDWYSNPMFLPYKKSLNFEKEISDKSKNNYKSWEASLKFFSQGNFPLKKTSDFSYPVFYLCGSEDKKYSDIKIANYFLISGAGHNPHKTHPAKLTEKLVNIL
jgi:2-succinyl-6-hydroxy-2,4-cyclohexadiene-1-carboxylate synthase